MRAVLVAALLVLAALPLPACSGGDDGPVLATGVHSTALEALDWSARDGWIVTRVPERDEDLNGDGDVTDAVLVAVEAATGRTTTLPLAAGAFVLAPPWIAFQVFESHQGARDLDDDGDVNDTVLHVHDLRGRRTRNLRLALPQTTTVDLSLDGDDLAFKVSEAFQGADLDGDGLVLGDVAHVVDLARGAPLSLGLRVAPGSPLVASGGRVLFTVFEPAVGDLNADGDASDSVLHVHDTVLGDTRNLRRAVLPTSLRAAGDLATVLISETEHGQVDLNGDGDAVDVLVEIHDLGTRRSLLVTSQVATLALSPELVLLGVFEQGLSSGLSDFNGDFDALDEVVFFYDRLTGALENTGLALPTRGSFLPPASAPVVTGRLAAFPVGEREQGNRDLDGDGEADDRVVHVVDGASGRVLSTGLAIAPGFRLLGLSDPFVAFVTPSFAANAPGLLVVRDLDAGHTRHLGVPAERLSVQEGLALAWTPRSTGGGAPPGTDLVAVQLATGTRFDTHVPMIGPGQDPEPGVRGNLVSLLAHELVHGRDLNGDGDTLDLVPLIVRLPFGGAE